jgi:hypothetical protein
MLGGLRVSTPSKQEWSDRLYRELQARIDGAPCGVSAGRARLAGIFSDYQAEMDKEDFRRNPVPCR